MIRKVLITALAGFAMIVAYCGPCLAAPGQKPRPPLQVRIVPVQQVLAPEQIQPGDAVEFQVTAMSLMDTQELKIDVDLTGGAELVSGSLSWTGPAGRNEEKTITFTVRAPEKGKIKARVSLPPSKGASFSAQAEYVLGEKLHEKKPEPKRPVKKDSKGRDVIEYRE